MLKQASDRDQLQQYVEAVRDQLTAPELQGAVANAAAGAAGDGDGDGDGDPVATLRSAIPDVTGAIASSGGRETTKVPYLSRDPIQSLLQSTIEEKLRQTGVRDQTSAGRDLFGTIVHAVNSLLHPRRFGPTDLDWVIDVGKSMLDRLAAGNHRFNPSPARHEIEDTARIVVVGDWGTGLPRAKAVAGFMAEEVAGALADGRQVHVIHLGDVYYSGIPEEVERHVLAPGLWPVTVDQARHGVTSWSLNGNHDMYGGGYGYYDHLLADERFSAQQSSDDKPTSFFELVAPSWQFLGLDTSWDPNVLAQGHSGVLEDPQSAVAAKAAAEARAAGRKLILLSHHQLVSVYDTADIGNVLPSKLRPILDGDSVTAWLWGHEHRCMGFKPVSGINFARCIGHGGVPVLMEHAAGEPIPSPGEWEEREFVEQDGDRWQRFGFAVLDMASDRIDVRYRDELGRQTRAETIV
jgi:hypothetical protein